MAQYTATLYKNTGFNTVDIPDSPALVKSFASVSASALYEKQNAPLDRVRIQKPFNDIKNCDYLELGNMFYFITDIKMLNDNVCELGIIEDSLTSLGGASQLKFIDGWCERKHVTSDNLFENIIPENFTPKEPLELKTFGIVADYDDAVVLLASTVDLTADWTAADVYVGQASGDDYQVTVPSLPGASAETKIYINTGVQSSVYGSVLTATLPGYGLYNYNDSSVKANVKKLRALGLETVLIGCYKIPLAYITSINDVIKTAPDFDDFVFCAKISMTYNDLSVFTALDAPGTTLEYGYGNYTPANKKVFAQYNDVTVFSTSGDINNYKVCDLRKVNFTTAETDDIYFAMFANGAPGGSPFIRPKYFEKEAVNSGNLFNNAVRGSTWANCPLVLEGASGSDLIQAKGTLSQQASQMSWDAATYNINEKFAYSLGAKAVRGLDVTAGATSLIGNNGNMTKNRLANQQDFSNLYGQVDAGTGIFGNIFNAYADLATSDPNAMKRNLEMLANEIMNQKLAYELSLNIVAPDIKFTQDVNIQLFLGNSFFAYALRLSDTDLERFDKYLTLYGYATSEPLTTSCFSGRVNYNFVQASGVSIEGTSSVTYSENNNRIRRILAAAQLNQGVRIWHTAPTTAKRFTNPIAT